MAYGIQRRNPINTSRIAAFAVMMLQPTLGFPLILHLLAHSGEPGGQRHQPDVGKAPVIGG
jgi:hypothetical protein